MYRQYDLQQKDRRLTTWLESRQALKPGTKVTLAKSSNTLAAPPAGWWQVVKAYNTRLPELAETRWRVGGLA